MDDMILCEICLKREKTRVRRGKYTCDFCFPENFFFPVNHLREFITSGFPNELVSRSKELGRRIILPDERKDGVSDYYVGRICENGKIADRVPDVSP